MRVKGRKEHEHDLTALREAAEHCPFPIAVYDDADRLVAWNPAYEADYDRAFAKLGDAARGEGVRYADFVRAQLEDVTPPELLDDVVAERCRQQEIETMVEQQTQVGDKAMLVYKYRLPSGALAGTAVEITELIEARREAESAARAKAGFLANMSHEVRTPMNGVLGVAALLAATDLNEEQRRLVEIIQSSGDALLALINEILDFSRLEAGKEDVSIAPVEVGDVVSDVIDLMRPLADQKGLSLVAEPASAVALETDALKLRQCLLNLVGNAVKFTETGGVRLSSRLEPTGPEGGSPAMLAITVADTGPGIAPERVSEVFTAYARLRDGVALRAEGAGLGLAIVRGIVDLLGGALDVETAPGEGAAFTIRLPASEIE